MQDMASQVSETDRAGCPNLAHRRSLSGDTVLATSPPDRHAGSMAPDVEKILDVQCLSPAKEVDSVSLSSFGKITPVLHDLTADREADADLTEILRDELRKMCSSEVRKIVHEACKYSREPCLCGHH